MMAGAQQQWLVENFVQKPRMKGVGFVNVRKYVTTHYGASYWKAVVETLALDDREVVEFGVAVGWYEVAAFARLLRIVDLVCGDGDLKLMPKIGAYEAERDYSQIYRIILRTMTPGASLAAERRLWTQFQDSGTWQWRYVDGGIQAVLADWEVDEALCIELGSYLARAIEFTGGRQASFEHSECRARGAEYCTRVTPYGCEANLFVHFLRRSLP